MAYQCDGCGKVFDEPRETVMSYSEYYGVYGGGRTFIMTVCPYCGEEEFTEIEEEGEDEDE